MNNELVEISRLPGFPQVAPFPGDPGDPYWPDGPHPVVFPPTFPTPSDPPPIWPYPAWNRPVWIS